MKYLFFLATLFCTPLTIRAASISLYGDSLTVKQGTEIVLDVALSADEPIDTLGGHIHFDSNVLTFKEARDANSLVNFWIEKPSLLKTGDIVFSGMTPGGLTGIDRQLFSMVFIANTDGSIPVDFRDGEVFYNDGTGVGHTLSFAGLSLHKKEGGGSSVAGDDREPPESFTAFLARDPSMFEGKYFLAFATQDKGSGIDHYEVREGNFGFFTSTKSPYVLRDQNLNQSLFIKAIDKVGNERLVERAPDHASYPWYKFLLFSILIGIIIIIVIVWRTLKK